MGAVSPRGWVAKFYRCWCAPRILSSWCATWLLPTRILVGAVRSRYFCFYDFTSRIADCSVCSGSTIATRIPNAVHRRTRAGHTGLVPIESTLDTILIPSSSSSCSRTSLGGGRRKLEPLESSIGSIKRSILRGRQIYEYEHRFRERIRERSDKILDDKLSFRSIDRKIYEEGEIKLFFRNNSIKGNLEIPYYYSSVSLQFERIRVPRICTCASRYTIGRPLSTPCYHSPDTRASSSRTSVSVHTLR